MLNHVVDLVQVKDGSYRTGRHFLWPEDAVLPPHRDGQTFECKCGECFIENDPINSNIQIRFASAHSMEEALSRCHLRVPTWDDAVLMEYLKQGKVPH